VADVREVVIRSAVCLALAATCFSCASSHKTASGAATLQSAADATAKAHSFTLSVAGADVIYQAPDRVQQVEHGEAMTASASNGGPASSSGPFAQTITKVFTGDRYFEARTRDGETPAFTSSPRCPSDLSAADAVLRLLRAIAASADVQTAGDTYTFHIPDQGGNTPTGGTATVSEGFVRTLSFPPSTEVLTIASVNNAPPVTEPSPSTPSNQSCN
jgi:hypothetical protein